MVAESHLLTCLYHRRVLLLPWLLRVDLSWLDFSVSPALLSVSARFFLFLPVGVLSFHRTDTYLDSSRQCGKDTLFLSILRYFPRDGICIEILTLYDQCSFGPLRLTMQPTVYWYPLSLSLLDPVRLRSESVSPPVSIPQCTGLCFLVFPDHISYVLLLSNVLGDVSLSYLWPLLRSR